MFAPASSLQLGAIFMVFIGSDPENLISSDFNPLNSPTCGRVQKQANSIQTRIVGGRRSESGWPWQIAVLDRRKKLICGGTLISSEFVLTAAHCITSGMYIIAGKYDMKESEDHEQIKKVNRVFKHPFYDKHNVTNDIALLRLGSPLKLSQRVWPACLPKQSEEVKPETMGTILGWGATSYRRTRDGKPEVERDDILHQAAVPVVSFDDCKKSYGDDLISPHVICAGYQKGEIDSCAGDSGGPFLLEQDNKWVVHGVTSYGDDCGKEGKYGIYSKTSAYIDWINEIVTKYTLSRTSF